MAAEGFATQSEKELRVLVFALFSSVLNMKSSAYRSFQLPIDQQLKFELDSVDVSYFQKSAVTTSKRARLNQTFNQRSEFHKHNDFPKICLVLIQNFWSIFQCRIVFVSHALFESLN